MKKPVFNKTGFLLQNGRGDRIRTYDLLVPNQALYQAKLHPEGADKGQSNEALST